MASPDPVVARVIDVDPQTDSRWDSFVREHPDGLVYHHSLWLRVIQRAYGHQPLCLACEGGDGSLLGVLPLFSTRGLLTGRRLSSLPHTPVGGPLARNDAAAAALVRSAIERVNRDAGTWLQLKLPSPATDGVGNGLVSMPGQTTYVLDLPSRVEDLRFGTSRNHARIRWSVRKASKQDVDVRCAETDAELAIWYGLYLDAMRRHGVPPRPFGFFKVAWDVLRPAGLMRLLLAEQRSGGNGRLVAGSMFLMLGSTVFYAFNGWQRQDLGQRANDAIQWQAIHDACREGYRRYDFGEVEQHNRGLADFKSKWGARAVQLYRYYYPAPSRLERRASASTGATILRSAWRWLPLPVTAWLGSRFYRGV